MKRMRFGGLGLPLGALSFAGLAPTYAYVYSMMISNAILGLPIFGGALYLCGRCGMLFAALRKYTRSGQVSSKWQWISRISAVVLMLLNVLLLIVYPISIRDGRVWLLVVLMVTQLFRHATGKQLLQVSRHIPLRRFLYGVLFVVSMAIAAWVLFYQLPAQVAWNYLAGFGLVWIIECFSILQEKQQKKANTIRHTSEQPFQLRQSLQQAGVFTHFEKLWGLLVLALQVTVMLMYTYLVLTAQEVLICMVIATATTLIPMRFVSWLRTKYRGGAVEWVRWLMLGIFLWMYSISLFGGMIRQDTMNLQNAYLCLGLCSAGASLALSFISMLETDMERVAKFVTPAHASAYASMRQMAFLTASMLAEMGVLVVWTVLSFQSGGNLPRNEAQLLAALHPWMLFPVVIMLASAILSAIRFPLSSRMMEKLSRILRIEAEGKENTALRHQLTDTVYTSKFRPIVIRLLKAILRPFYRTKLMHSNRLIQDPENPIVLLCNHGELYGPIVAALHVPIPIRSWSISEMVLDKNEVAEYIYRFTLKRQKWLPNFLKMPLARFIGPISVWVMMQLENIPVYRNKPAKLRITFRETVEAMQAGDNVMIFPENPDADVNNKGYVRDGVGEFFTGFSVIAPLYYNKTGKRCRFVPMYADKIMGMINFGHEVRYDPENDPSDEQARIVKTTHDAMLALRAEILAQNTNKGA